MSSIYRFTSGTPFVVSYGGCNHGASAGTCEVDLNPNYTGNATQGGVATATSRCSTSIRTPSAPLKPSASTTPGVPHSPISKYGNAPRTAPYGLRNPYFWQDDVRVSRSFNIIGDRLKFIAEVTCVNIFNHPTLSNPTATWGPR